MHETQIPNMIEYIIETLSKTYDPLLNNEERQKNFLILDNYQNELFHFDHLKIFLSPLVPIESQIFGLKCLENLILYKWNTVDKNTAKAYLIEIIREYDNFSRDANSERVIRWIISKCVMYFIRHECPQNCSTLIHDLINIQTNGTATQALILSIFYCMSEILPIDSHMSDKRKKEVIRYLTDHYHEIIDFCLKIVGKCSDNQSDSFNLQTESVQTIKSLTSWIKIDNLNSSAEKIFTVLIAALKVNSSDYYIWEVIETVIVNGGRYVTLLSLMKNEQNWHRLMINIKTGLSLEINPYSDEKFRYFQKLIDFLLIIGNTMSTNFGKLCSEVGERCFQEIMDSINLATHHPVKILAIEMLSFWYNGFKIEDENLKKVLVSHAHSLLALLRCYSVRQSVRNPSNVDHEYLLNLFQPEDEDDYTNGIRFEASKAISTLTEFFSQDIVCLNMDMVHSIIDNVQRAPGFETEQQFSSGNSDIVKDLEASRFFTRCVMHSVFRPYSKTLREQVESIFSTYPKGIIDKGYHIITMILSADDRNVHLVTLYLDILCLLLPFTANHSDIVKASLEKIFVWFTRAESLGQIHLDYGNWKQIHNNCGVWILRIFRDFDFLVSISLFESILDYYQSISNQLYDHPIIVEAITIYLCQNSHYSEQQKQSIMCSFIDHIKQVLLTVECNSVFDSGNSVITYLHMDKPIPLLAHKDQFSYPSENHQQFRKNIIKAITSLHGICLRLSAATPETEMNSVIKEIPLETNTNPCLLNEHIMPLLQILLKMLRALNQIWSSTLLHSDFSNFKDISTFYRDTILRKKNVEKLSPKNALSFIQLYGNGCRNFVYRLHETIWLILGKCCLSLRHNLYHLPEWQRSITEFVFADLDSLPNFKLTPLIKSFIIPFVIHCPTIFFPEVIHETIVPFMNFMFENLDRQWTNKSTMISNSEEIDFQIDKDLDQDPVDGEDELCNEIIEDKELRNLTRALCELFRLTMLCGNGMAVNETSSKAVKLGPLMERLSENGLHSNCPMLLVVLNNICRAIIWKDQSCILKLSQFISPLLIEINKRKLLTFDIVIFVFQQTICALNNCLSCSNSVHTLLSVCVDLYDEYIVHNPEYRDGFFQLLSQKSSEKSIQSFQNQMRSPIGLKKRREHMRTFLQPYLAVPTNQLFSQEVYIKDLPPLMKPHWKKKTEFLDDDQEPLCLADLFKC